MNYASLNSSINTTNEGAKHGSYQRRLNRLKGKVMKGNSTTVASTPKRGNKVKSYKPSSKYDNCDC